ncbi:MAG: dihydrolipoyl dehydrogenase [Anaplasma sp.]
MESCDFAVVGSGPGGYIAAIRAAQLGYSVTVIEKEEQLGGICLNWGCIPTKALLKSAEVYSKLLKADSFGVTVKGDISVDIAKVVSRSREAVGKLGGGVAGLMNKHGIKVLRGYARMQGGGKVSIKSGKGESVLAAKHIILATGASLRRIPGLDEKMLWTARDAMVPDSLPKSLLIVGSGAIGVEFASFYSCMGSKVSLLEMCDCILPLEDREVSAFMHKQLLSRGVEILTCGSIKSLKRNGPKMEAEIQLNNKGSATTATIQCDKVLSAIGISPNSGDLGLENTKATLDKRGYISVNDYCCTSEPGLYAIGDVAGPPCLAHKASHQAVICVENIAASAGILPERPHVLSARNIPSCIYSAPQVASIGLTEEQAKAQGFEVRVGTAWASCNGKAIVSGAVDGFAKVILDATTGELLGAHMVGEEVTEMINGYIIGKKVEATDLDLLSAVFPHPTMSEMMHEAILAALGKPLNS